MTGSAQSLDSASFTLRLQHFATFSSGFPALALVPTEVAAGEFLPSELWFTVAA